MGFDLVGPGDAGFYSTLASVAATFIGLSFLELSFFLIELPKRFSTLSLPVYRDEDVRAGEAVPHQDSRLQSLSDYALFDGDPLVIYVAWSVFASWMLYLLPFAISLAALVADLAHVRAMASLLTLFAPILVYSVGLRAAQYRRLRTYRTREEQLWPVFNAVTGLVYLVVTGYFWYSAVSGRSMPFDGLLLKLTAVAALIFGMYVTNKDLFVFFKAMSSDQMRQRWFDDFVARVHPAMQARVGQLLSALPSSSAVRGQLAQEWQDGTLPLRLVHRGMWENADRATIGIAQSSSRKTWTDARLSVSDLHDGCSVVPSWMFDVPHVARWAARVEGLIADAHRESLTAPGADWSDRPVPGGQ